MDTVAKINALRSIFRICDGIRISVAGEDELLDAFSTVYNASESLLKRLENDLDAYPSPAYFDWLARAAEDLH